MINPGKLLKMQSEAKKMQNQLRQRKISGESKNGMIKIYMNAAQEFEDVWIHEDYLDEDMLEAIKKGFKEAYKDYQKKLQKEMTADMDIDQLRNMLG